MPMPAGGGDIITIIGTITTTIITIGTSRIIQWAAAVRRRSSINSTLK
jgi:hypothetical protein